MTHAKVDTSTPLWRSYLTGLIPHRRVADAPLSTHTIRDHAPSFDAHRLAGYQRLCGFAVDDVLPSPFLQVLSFPAQVALMAQRCFPLPLAGLIHVTNSMTQHRRVHHAERLEFTVHAEDLRAHPRGRQVDLVAQAQVAGETVWGGRSTYLHRTSEDTGARSGSQLSLPPAAAVWRLPADTGRRYAALSGDVNPIHLSRLTARASGFRRPIAHGMYLAARTQSALEPRLPERFRIDVTFRRPVYLPSDVGLNTRRTDTGWQAELIDRRGQKRHLTLSVVG